MNNLAPINNFALASKICDRINQRFPYISPNKIARLNYKELASDKDLLTKLKFKQMFLMQARENRNSIKDNPFEFYKALIKDTDRIRALNCQEYSYFSYLGMRMNGIKNCKAIKPYLTEENKIIDHVLIQNDNIFLDAWLGIADFGNKLKDLYKKIFQINPNTKLDFIQKPIVELSDEDVKKIKPLIPELDLTL